MNENKNYDNGFSNFVLLIVGTIVRTLERAIVVFWDGLRSATEHGTPSILGFIAAFLPAIMPLPIAAMTAYSLMTFLGWAPWQAVTMAAGIEGAGFVLWVTLVETLMDGGWKGTTMQYFFGGAVAIYEILLVLINTVLTWDSGATWDYVAILFLACLFPALSAVSYGYRNHGNKKLMDTQRQEAKALEEKRYQEQREIDERRHKEQLELEEKIRQERREDRFKMAQMKQQYAKDAERPELTYPPVRQENRNKPFRGNGKS